MRSTFRSFLPYLLLIALLASGYIYVHYIAVPDVDRSDTALQEAVTFRARLSAIQSAPQIRDITEDARYDQFIDLLSRVPEGNVGRSVPFSR